MISFTYRPLQWDRPRTPVDQRRSRWPFKAGWSDTLNLLQRELGYLDARNCVLEADFREYDLRQDGMPRANARQPDFPGVRIAFDSKHGPLVYATDTHDFWQHNVRAIALSLEALRSVDRYGVTKRAEQYTGWKAIGSGPTAMPAGPMSREEAAKHIAQVVDPVGGGREGIVNGILHASPEALRGVEVVGARVNIKSLRTDGKGILAVFHADRTAMCTEGPLRADLTFTLDHKSTRRVEAARERLRERNRRRRAAA